jgi:hypothetical protein
MPEITNLKRLERFILAHGFSPVAMVCGEAGDPSGEHMGEQPAHLMVARKKKEERVWSSTIPFEGMPPKTLKPPMRTHLLNVLPPASSVMGWGPSLQQMGRRGTLIQTLALTMRSCVEFSIRGSVLTLRKFQILEL